MLGGGKTDRCCTRHEAQTLQKASHCQTKVFLYSCTVPATYHVTLKAKGQCGQVTLVFQLPPSHPPLTVQKGPKESGLFPKRWSLTSRHGYARPRPPPPFSSKQTVHMLNRGGGRVRPKAKAIEHLQTIRFIETFNCGLRHARTL